MKDPNALAKAKLALAFGMFSLAIPLAPNLLGFGPCTSGCGSWSGSSGYVGSCWVDNQCTICTGGTCCNTYVDCGGGNSSSGMSCTC
jgi:hypothetical protein